MTALAPALQAYFTDRLISQRNSSPETIAAYRDAFRLLLRFAADRTGKQPFELDIDEPSVLQWVGLPALADGEKQWMDVAAIAVDSVVPNRVLQPALQA